MALVVAALQTFLARRKHQRQALAQTASSSSLTFLSKNRYS
jgi:hypothetical protein